MDVNILTSRIKSKSNIFGILTTVSVAFLASSCGNEPHEGEIVILAEDIAQIDSLATADTLPQLDSLHVVLQDTVTQLDTVAVLPADTLPSNLPVEPDSAVCTWNRIAFEISGSIYASLRDRADEPDILGAHIVRCMWWNTDPWNGMNAGDSLYVLTGETGRENQVVALRYVARAGTVNESFSVYSFRMTGDNYPSHYYTDGTEVMKLLNYMPITTFEEMTGPFGEPRGNHSHRGVDYKAPAGTPIRTCRGGRVARLNWNHDYNGNCVEIDIGSGYSEIFLHLESIAEGISEGVILVQGDAIGYVGNTGVTSTASHIHYQINDEDGYSIDPYLFYGSHRRRLPEEDMAEFSSFRNSCDQWLIPIPE